MRLKQIERMRYSLYKSMNVPPCCVQGMVNRKGSAATMMSALAGANINIKAIAQVRQVMCTYGTECCNGMHAHQQHSAGAGQVSQQVVRCAAGTSGAYVHCGVPQCNGTLWMCHKRGVQQLCEHRRWSPVPALTARPGAHRLCVMQAFQEQGHRLFICQHCSCCRLTTFDV